MLLPFSQGLCLCCHEKKNCPQPPSGTTVPHGTVRRMGFKGGSATYCSVLVFIQTRQRFDAVSSCIIFLFLVRSTLSGRWCSCTPASFCQGGRSID